MSDQYLQPTGAAGDFLGNLRAALQGVGSGGGTGDTFLKVDDRTGGLTYGQERIPLPEGSRFVAGLQGFRHGYISMNGGQVEERNVVPMMAQPARPAPPGGRYGTYEGGGPRDVTEVELNSVDEPGFNLVYTAWGVSSANRVRNLLEQALNHVNTPDGQGGFVHPVIVPKAGMYRSKKYKRDVWHFDFDVVDWLHTDGKTLLSQGGRPAVQDGNGRAPWEDEEVDDLP